MGKIKKQTPIQKQIHEKAVKLRKMTDEQLVERLSTAQNTVNGNSPSTTVNGNSPSTVGEFLRDLEKENIRGIGKVTIKKIGEFAKAKGYI